MNNELLTVLEYLENERGIPRETLIKVIEDALVSSARKSVGPVEDLRVEINPETGDIRVIANMEVTEKVEDQSREISLTEARSKDPDLEPGDTIDWEVTPANFGRIAAQKTRQNIMQRLREAEQQRVYDEYRDYVDHMLSGVVQRIEGNEIIVKLPDAEGVLPKENRIPGEEYQPNDHICCILAQVNISSEAPTLILSRTHPLLVQRLFEREVTEISEGLLEIKSVAREPGYRSKIAVLSHDSSIDPVGACVGMRGNRVKTVVRELGGEKVDIITWNSDIKTFVANALQPAKLTKVEIDEENHQIHIEAPEDQLSLAIGKKGQNARLAAKLTGWRIDISQLQQPQTSNLEDKMERAAQSLCEHIPNLDEVTARNLIAKGFISAQGLCEAEPEDLLSVEGLDENKAEEIIQAARESIMPGQ
ncbi:MAG: transcription termination factor NusA [Lentisphaeria bacterium]